METNKNAAKQGTAQQDGATKQGSTAGRGAAKQGATAKQGGAAKRGATGRGAAQAATKQKVCGGLSVANGVISDMAGYAALETYGVVGMAAPTLTDGIAKLLPRARLRRGVTVKVAEDNSIKIDLYIVVEYGVSLSEVSRMLAENVRFTLEDSAQLPVADVEVHVQGIKVRNQLLLYQPLNAYCANSASLSARGLKCALSLIAHNLKLA